MDENLHDIEDLFHSALNDHDETPSQQVWEAVDKRLDKDNIVIIKRKYANLKRIAVLLLFLLIGFALFDIYKSNLSHKGNGLAKKEDSIEIGKQTTPNTITGEAAKKNTETNSLAIHDTSNNNIDIKEKPLFENIATANQKPISQHQFMRPYIAPFQKKDRGEKKYWPKDVKENQAGLTPNQKKKRNTKERYRIKIANPMENEESSDQGDYVDNQIPFLPKKNDRPFEESKIKLKDSAHINKVVSLIVSANPKAVDSNNNIIAKIARKKTGKLSRFSFTPFFSSDIAWYRLQDDETGQPDDAIEIEKEEKHGFSYTYGVMADYRMNKHWGLQTGLTLSNTIITIEPKTIYAQQDNTGSVKYRINTSSGYGYVLPSFSSSPSIGDSLYAFTSAHSLQYIGIPLAVTYTIKKDPFTFNALAGVSANILTRAKLETRLEKGFTNSIETLDNIQGLKKIYFSGLAGIGIDYRFSKKTALTFAPTMRFALNSINKDAPVKSYPMSLGFTVGLKIDL